MINKVVRGCIHDIRYSPSWDDDAAQTGKTERNRGVKVDHIEMAAKGLIRSRSTSPCSTNQITV